MPARSKGAALSETTAPILASQRQPEGIGLYFDADRPGRRAVRGTQLVQDPDRLLVSAPQRNTEPTVAIPVHDADFFPVGAQQTPGVVGLQIPQQFLRQELTRIEVSGFQIFHQLIFVFGEEEKIQWHGGASNLKSTVCSGQNLRQQPIDHQNLDKADLKLAQN
ncbi:MAG: hypothetical protein AAGA63_14330 [Pseudomonadota bacterium]